MTPCLATDIITFYHPRFWGLKTSAELNKWVAGHVDQFWQKIFEALTETGVTGLELTFDPGSIENVLKAFGTAKAFKHELDNRGLAVVSCFMGEVLRAENDLGKTVADAERRAAFLVDVGGDILATGLPMRKTRGERPALFVDAAFMTGVANVAHVVGEAISQQGVKLAIHTESNSSLWYERDIDLFMSLTDPRYVGLCPDSCHITLGGGDPVRVAQRYNQRVTLAHWKDAVGVMDADLVIDETVHDQQQRYMADFGAGVVDWSGWSEAMMTTPGKNIILLELDAAPDPIAALKAGRAVVEELRG